MLKNPNIFSKLVLGMLLLAITLSLSCSEKSDADRLRDYFGANASYGSLSPISQAPNSGSNNNNGGQTTVVDGTPRVVNDGQCGDGIINGPKEDCDKNAIQNVSCRDYNGLYGTVKCQDDCLYDISDCITPAVDLLIGGRTEQCDCFCTNSRCTGGCNSLNFPGQSSCDFDCDNDCRCQCESQIEASMQECKFICVCEVLDNGSPQCQCSLSECKFVASISPHISSLARRGSTINPSVAP